MSVISNIWLQPVTWSAYTAALYDTRANRGGMYRCTTAGSSVSGPVGTGAGIPDGGTARWAYVGPGITAWTGPTIYAAVGARVSNGSNAFQLVTAGTSASSGGPIGTGASIADGTCVWKWLCYIDYTTFSGWASGLSAGSVSAGGVTTTCGSNTGVLSSPVTCLFWNGGEYVPAGSGTMFSLTGHTTTATNNITVTVASGDSFKDNPNRATNRYSYVPGNGWAARQNNLYRVNAVDFSDPNIIIDGLQMSIWANDLITSPGRAYGGNLANGAGGIVRNCIFAGATSQFSAGNVSNTNNLFIGISVDSAGVFVNNTTVLSSDNAAAGYGVQVVNTSADVVRNNAIFGHATAIQAYRGSTGADGHNATDLASMGLTSTGNLTSVASWTTAGTVFVQPSNAVGLADFRLALGSVLIGAAATDITDLPVAIDAVGTSRPQGSGWDIGAWEYVSAAINYPKALLATSAPASLLVRAQAAAKIALIGSTVLASRLARAKRISSGAATALLARASAIIRRASIPASVAVPKQYGVKTLPAAASGAASALRVMGRIVLTQARAISAVDSRYGKSILAAAAAVVPVARAIRFGRSISIAPRSLLARGFVQVLSAVSGAVAFLLSKKVLPPTKPKPGGGRYGYATADARIGSAGADGRRGRIEADIRRNRTGGL